ncbi:hypothetical protein QF042_003732 [Pedobacter sp. W3I1]|nr:hypothetical protein [Pedobacter sp. W3I1]
MPHIIICSVLSGIIWYFFVFKNDKYLKYFDKFQKCSKVEKWKYAWLTLGSIVALSPFLYRPYNLK